jgi:hypothetical protein
MDKDFIRHVSENKVMQAPSVLKSMVFWVVTLCSLEKAQYFGGKSSGVKNKPRKKPEALLATCYGWFLA